MPLIEVPHNIPEARLPRDVEQFLDESNERIRVWVEDLKIQVRGFVPSDFDVVFHSLQAVADQNLATGDVFCEWGSGFGVVAMMASMLEFQSYGIEIDRGLVDCSRQLADDYDIPVDFVTGSFVPPGAEELVEENFAGSEWWLTSTSDDAYEKLGLQISDFDVVYAFPWPGEQHVLAALFEEYAAVGALLLTLDQLEGVTVQRKVVRV